MAYYLDTSAAVKLVVEEAGSEALHRWLMKATEPILSSDLLRTELLRATRRGAPDLGDDLHGVITYDDRLASAAAALGIVVIAPT